MNIFDRFFVRHSKHLAITLALILAIAAFLLLFLLGAMFL